MSSPNKFIRPAGKNTSPSQPAAAQKQVEVLSTRTFEFPQERGATPAPQPNHQVAQQPIAEKPVVISPLRPPVTEAPPQPSTKIYAEVDPAYASIDLPSGFQFYSNKSLCARNLAGAHLAKFSRAHKEGRLRYSVEALSASMEPGLSAFDLTPGDFYFLMYWQRVNSFAKNPMVITAWCDNEDHHHSVLHGDEVDDPDNPGKKKLVKKDEATLKNEAILTHTTLETQYLDPVDLSQFDVAKKFSLGVETMRDVVEVTEMLQDLEGDPNEEQLFLAKYAPFLKTGPGQSNLAEKLLVAGRMDSDDLLEMDRYIEVVTGYGVSEYAVIKCKECGAKMRVKISIDALTFLPSGR